MLPHEVTLTGGPFVDTTGLDVYYDETNDGTYTYQFIGYAPLGTNQNSNAWWIFVFKTTIATGLPAAERYYTKNQNWSTHSSLALP